MGSSDAIKYQDSGSPVESGFGKSVKSGFGEDSEIGFWGVLRNRVYGNRLKNGFSYIPPIN
jgi:hypothetical protein